MTLNSRTTSLALALIVAIAGFAWGGRTAMPSRELSDLAAAAIAGSRLEREHAVRELRAAGPEGLVAVLALADRRQVQDAARWRAAVDAIAGQRDASASKLYWYTDLEQAKAAARTSGKPILSLRLLGLLTDDLSCANSRFFRTVLYANAEVSGVLREDFVLHWESVRPVPKLTVDFGDGRFLRTTITGNSIHHVLTSDGVPVDALPGLWGSAAFLSELELGGALAREVATMPTAERDARLMSYHARRKDELATQFASDFAMTAAGRAAGADAVSSRAAAISKSTRPRTGMFSSLQRGMKVRMELPLIRGLVPGTEPLRGEIDDATWDEIAALHADECRLDEQSRELMRVKEHAASAAGDVRLLAPMFLSLERSVANDTVRNQYDLHRQISEWFAAGEVGEDLPALNERVYAELFLSPSNDAWLGLIPPDTYSAIDGGGRSGGTQ